MNSPHQEWAHGLVGHSPQIANIRRLIEKDSRNKLPVILTGESGTGKAVVARAIHNANPRGEFVTIDCGSLVGTLMESELFGHVKGSFTNATESKKGLVEIADKGTAFFDEIGDLPLEMQVKLLRLIQEGQMRAVGSTTWKKVDLRIIAATHRDLKAEVAAGRFRLDLFYRLNVFSIKLPALRDRKEDVPLLIEHFLKSGHQTDEPAYQPSKEIINIMLDYHWPGNVRELKHCMERMVALSSEGSLHMADLPSAFQNHAAQNALGSLLRAVDPLHPMFPIEDEELADPGLSIEENERQLITKALGAAKGQRGRAAELLKMSRTTLYRRMKDYGLE